jgi:nucleoside-diphosphate kinase
MNDAILIVLPEAVSRHLTGPIIGIVEQWHLKIFSLCKTTFTATEATSFYANRLPGFQEKLAHNLASGPCVILRLRCDEAFRRAKDLVGNFHPEEAKHGTLRRLFAKDAVDHVVHIAKTPEETAMELCYLMTLGKLA